MTISVADRKRLRVIHTGMVGRCHDPANMSFFKYGEIGIFVCDEWRLSFAAFVEWAVSNGYCPELQIDRIKPWLGYSPENCRWATQLEQQLNKRVRKVTSQHIGVRRHECGLFEARIRFGGKRIQLGYFRNEDDAGKAYREAVLKYHGRDLNEVLCRYST